MRVRFKILLSAAAFAAIHVFFLIPVSCSTIAVAYNYDKKVNFAKYYTYAFGDGLNKLSIRTFDKECIQRALENEMELRGYRSFRYTSSADTFDLLVDVQTKKSIMSRTTVAAAGSDKLYAAWGYEFSPGFATSHIDLDKYKDDALFINVIESKQQKIIWQGRGTKAFDDTLPTDVREANINFAVGMIFRTYPVPSSR